MKNGKIILGGAAFIVTAASALAFKAHTVFGKGTAVWGHTVAGGTCKVSTCISTATNVHSRSCTTLVGGNSLLDHFKTSGCATAVTKWTGAN